MKDDSSGIDWIARVQGQDEVARARACDLVPTPEDLDGRRRLVAALLSAMARGETRGKTAALRALRRVWLPGLPGGREVTLCALSSEDVLLQGAAVDTLRSMLERDPTVRRVARALLAPAISRGASLCLDLEDALCEPAGPLLEDELDLLEALRWRLAEELPAQTRREAAEALGALGPRAASVALWLLEVAGDLDPELALSALRALLKIAPEEPETGAAAARLLARREREAIQVALEICVDHLRQGPPGALVQALSPATLRPLLGPLWTPAIQRTACELLGERGEAQDIELLLGYLADAPPQGLTAAWEALLALARRGVLSLERALALLRSRGPRERVLAVALLGTLAPFEASARAALLRSALEDPLEILRASAAAVLRECATDDERRALTEHLSPEARPWLRRRAVALMTHLGPLPEQLPTLQGLLQDPDEAVRSQACRAFARMGGEVAPETRSALEAACPILLRCLAEPAVGPFAREALRALAPTPPRGFPLARLLGDKIDWEGVCREVFGGSALPGDEATWMGLVVSRIRWTEGLLKRPPRDLPDRLDQAVEVLLELGAARNGKRNGRTPQGAAGSLRAGEIAWLLSMVWRKGHKAG